MFHLHLLKQKDSKLRDVETSFNHANIELQNQINVLTANLKTQHEELELKAKAYTTLEEDYREKTR